MKRSGRAALLWVVTQFGLLAPAPAFALATPTSPAPHAEAAVASPAPLDRMLGWMGGREAIGDLRSLAVRADCSGPGGAFTTEVDSLRPAWARFRQTSSEGTTEIWTAPANTWTRATDEEVRLLDDRARSFVRAHEFHLLLLDVETRFEGHRADGVGEVGGAPCQTIEMRDEGGHPASLCIADADGRPLELVMNPPGAQGPLRIRFADWRPVGDLRLFHSFVLEEGEDRIFTYRYDAIEPDGLSALEWIAPPPPGREEDQKALVEVLRRDREAHLSADADLLVRSLADEMVDVSAGRSRSLAREEIEAGFAEYFAGVVYQQWMDIEPPVLRFSADGSMAWVARRVTSTRRVDPDTVETFSSAYLATYKKVDGDWKMTTVSSTFAPRAADPGGP